MSQQWNDQELLHWNATRKGEQEYEQIKHNIEQQGLNVKLQWHADASRNPNDPFYSLRVSFPESFEHLLRPEAVAAKEQTSSGFHISLGHRSSFHDNMGILRELNGLYTKYKQPKEVRIKCVRVAPSSVINIDPHDKLYRELSKIVYHGTWKLDPHISMD